MTAKLEDVVRIGKKLEKMAKTNNIDVGAAVELLKTLKRHKITLDILQKTRIGMTVNTFRKSCDNDEVVSLAKGLIKGWKKLLPTDAKSPASSESKEHNDSIMSKDTETPADSGDSLPGSEEVQRQMELVRQSSERASETNDPVRIKCRELLSNAFKCTELPEGCLDPHDVAAAIEDNIFAEFKSTDTKYKNRIRSRVSNLKDMKNPNLRKKVLYGIITPERLATMSSEELASDDMKELRDRLTREAINDHQMATNGGTTTSLFKCNKCGKRSCTYNQLQTRSADEPMTTFVLCNECGNRWKFC